MRKTPGDISHNQEVSPDSVMWWTGEILEHPALLTQANQAVAQKSQSCDDYKKHCESCMKREKLW